MKLLFTYIILFFLFKSEEILAVDSYWELVSMSPPRGNAWNIDCNSQDDIFISSDNGVFRLSKNAQKWDWILKERVDPVLVLDNDIILAQRMIKKGVNYFWSEYSIFYSFDNGNTWIEINKFWAPSYYLYNTCKNSLSDKILCSFHKDFENTNLEYYITSDYGKTFHKTGSLISDSFKINSKFIFFDSTIIQLAYSTYDGFICKSTDLGKSWKQQKIKDILPLNIYFKDLDEIYLLTHRGVYCSNDTGNTWNLKWLDGITIFNCIFKGKDTTLVSTNNGLYISINRGKDWNITEFYNIINLGSLPSWFLSTDKKGYIYSAPLSYGIYVSSNNGDNWYEKNNGFSSIYPNDISFLDSSIYISSLGLFKSTDKGSSFFNAGLNKYNLGSIAFNSWKEIFVADLGLGYTDKGIFRSTNDGSSWKNFTSHESVVSGLVINNKNIIFKSNPFGNLSRSTDNGETWEYPPVVLGKFLAINDEDHIFGFSGGKIFRSTDDGETWEKLAETHVDPTYNENGGRIIFNNKTKTAGYYDLVTTDNGRTWVEQIYHGMSFGTTESNYFAVDSTYNWIYARNNYILRSTDNGLNWKRMDTSGLNHREFKSIGCSPDGHIFVFGATGGLYRSRDKFVSVEEKLQPSDELVSPNPAYDFIEISVGANGCSPLQTNIKILNIYAQTVLSVGAIHELPLRIDVSSLPLGIYLIRIGDKVSKFVKL